MLDHGHPEARHYPIGYLWDEVTLVRERLNQAATSEATLLQLAVGSLLSNETGKQFKKALDALNVTAVAVEPPKDDSNGPERR